MPRKNFYLTVWEPGPVKKGHATHVKRRWRVVFRKQKIPGYCDFAKRTIELSDKLKGWQLLGTLFHELAHGCNNEDTESPVERVEYTFLNALKTILPKIQDELEDNV